MKKIVVLAKQVPDTENISGEAMKADGTVNRAKLPAIFNPEDLNALEMGLQIKEKVGGKVYVFTMGPPKAAEILKQALYRGVDHVGLISDIKFAGADTLATSYVLATVIKQLGNVDIVLAGRQAIDGDTAQVGPQTAEKIGFNQVTYVTELKEIDDHHMVLMRDGETQSEIIKTGWPVLLTVTSQANTPRYPNCRRMLQYFRSQTNEAVSPQQIIDQNRNSGEIPVYTRKDLGLEVHRCGLKGSPTKVYKIKSITLTGGELEMYGSTDKDIRKLVRDIIKEYTEVA